MELSKRIIATFQRKIFDWWKTHRRDLPWRRTHDPYHILVSEVMLQQTQVSRVLPKYKEFLSLFPNVSDLAQASPAQVLRVWKGMGYNRRALYLKRAARDIVHIHKGLFPKSEEELLKLPGLGTYTARAVLVFAYKQNVSLVDTNIRQIITHYFFDDVLQTPAVIQRTADALVPWGKSWEWHQALMDYGSLELKKIRPSGMRVGARERKKSRIPFKQTNRYYRGRIIDVLREHAWTEGDLIRELSEAYDTSEDFIEFIIKGLADDGLVTRKNNSISLPGS